MGNDRLYHTHGTKNLNNQISNQAKMRISNKGHNQVFLITHNDIENVVSSTVSKVLSHIREEHTLLQKIYTREEAAKILKISPQTVSTYVQKGLLNPAYTGRKMLFSHEQLTNFTKPKISNRWKM